MQDPRNPWDIFVHVATGSRCPAVGPYLISKVVSHWPFPLASVVVSFLANKKLIRRPVQTPFAANSIHNGCVPEPTGTWRGTRGGDKLRSDKENYTSKLTSVWQHSSLKGNCRLFFNGHRSGVVIERWRSQIYHQKVKISYGSWIKKRWKWRFAAPTAPIGHILKSRFSRLLND